MHSINSLSNIKRLLEKFNAKVRTEHIFKPTTRNEKSHEIGIDNEIRILNFDATKNSTVKSIMFPHRPH